MDLSMDNYYFDNENDADFDSTYTIDDVRVIERRAEEELNEWEWVDENIIEESGRRWLQ